MNEWMNEKYFHIVFPRQDILTSEDIDKSPIIFMRDVTFFELQSLIQFIYSGRTIVPGMTNSSWTSNPTLNVVLNIVVCWHFDIVGVDIKVGIAVVGIVSR